MRARIRPSFLMLCLLIFLPGSFLFVQAQIHGTPASVTSIGFGPTNAPPGVPASVTSLGPNGFGNGFGNCCINPFFISRPPLAVDARRLHHHRDHGFSGISGPIYVPYAVPYPVPYDETGDDGSAETDSYSHVGPATHDRRPDYREDALVSKAHRPSADPAASETVPAGSDPPAPVAAQPATLLIFKNGNQSEVVNYAIVGETLFDFTEGRYYKILLADLDLPATQKANDDRGVDFRIPAKSELSQKK